MRTGALVPMAGGSGGPLGHFLHPKSRRGAAATGHVPALPQGRARACQDEGKTSWHRPAGGAWGSEWDIGDPHSLRSRTARKGVLQAGWVEETHAPGCFVHVGDQEAATGH